jgi:predicted amidophosphoribosyltransferase
MAPAALLPAGEPLGFPRCSKCPYRRMGPAWICAQCASKTLESIAPGACPVCSQMLDGDSPCRNWLCEDQYRRIERIHAIAYLSGPLKAKILSYKYEGKTGWALIFARLLVGSLDANATSSPPDLIVANPTYTDAAQPGSGHVESIIAAASVADIEDRWAFDDVCTTGSQLNAVAGYLLDQGQAARVRALVLARAPWRPPRCLAEARHTAGLLISSGGPPGVPEGRRAGTGRSAGQSARVPGSRR